MKFRTSTDLQGQWVLTLLVLFVVAPLIYFGLAGVVLPSIERYQLGLSVDWETFSAVALVFVVLPLLAATYHLVQLVRVIRTSRLSASTMDPSSSP
jgi:ACR3 family arsenite efflux pump ArsB